jgi:leucyl-tRNA---protein transferase
MESALHYISNPDQCGYLSDRQWRFENVYVLEMSPAEYNDYLDLGWRRFGRTLFRPRCQSCSACQSVRISAADFSPNRSQKRNASVNREDVRLDIGRPDLTAAKLALYDGWHDFQSIHKGWDEHPGGDADDYHAHFLDNPIPTEEWRYYLGRTLIGVGYVDVVPRGLSGIYFYYEPAMRRRGLGIWNVLSLIDQARRRNLAHIYLGYFVVGCATMLYKSQFYPQERRQPDGRWKRYENARC